jgi:hypothetical protein
MAGTDQGSQPVDPLASWLPSAPTMGSTPAPAHNAFVSGLGQGFTGLASGVGGTSRALGALVGAPSMEEWGKAYQADAEARAATYARPDLDQQSWYTPGRLAQTIGGAIPGVGAAVLGGEIAGPLGVGAAMYPQMVGENVKAGGPDMDRAAAAKALALGVPEAAVMSVMPAGLGRILEDGAAGGLAKRVLTGGAVMGGVGGVASAINTGIMQQAYTPDMPLNERTKQVIDSFFSGAVQGGVFGGVLSGIRKTRAPDQPPVSVADQTAEVDTALQKGGLPAVVQNGGLPATTGEAPTHVGGTLTPESTPDQFQKGLPAPTPPAGILPSPEKMANLTKPGEGNYSGLESGALKTAYDAFVQRGTEATPAEAVQRDMLREEMSRRTVPGLPLGEGTLMTPEDVAARAPAIEALKSQVIADVPKTAQDQPFFKNFNASNEPELINAIKAQADTYKKLSKAPEWFKTLANDYGVMDGSDRTSPAEELEDLKVKRAQAQALVDKSVEAGSGKAARAAKTTVDSIDADTAKFQALDELHRQGDQMVAAAREPALPEPNTATPLPDLTPQPRTRPTDLNTPAGKKWDQLDALVKGDHSNDNKTAALDMQAKIESDGANAIKQQDIVKLQKKATADAVQERGAAPVDAQEQPDNGGGVRGGDTGGSDIAGTLPAEAEPKPPTTAGVRGGDTGGSDIAGTLPAEAEPKPPTTAGVSVSESAPPETHWETARRLGLAGEQAPIVPEVKAKVVPRAVRDKAALFARFDAEPDGPKKEAMADTLASGDPKQIRAHLEQLAKDEQTTGTKPSAAAMAQSKGAPVLDVGGVPEWANVHARDLSGQVISHNADHALIRGTDETGSAFYSVADRATGTRTPLRAANTPDFLPRAQRDRERMDVAARTNPDGPFSGAKQNVVGTKSADPRVVGMVSDWASQLGMGKVRIAIVHPDDVQNDTAVRTGAVGKYSAARMAGSNPNDMGHMNTFGPGGKDFYIYLKPGMSDTLTTEVVAHEMGHVIEHVLLHNAPTAVQKSINDAFDAYYKQTQGLKGEDLMKLSRNRQMSGDLFPPGSLMSQEYRKYLTSKAEWFADQVSRWATTAEKPRSTIEKFFAAVGQKLREFLQMLTGNKFTPASEVADFLNHMQPDSDQAWLQGRGVMSGQIPLDEPLAARSAPGSDQLAHEGIDNVVERVGRWMADAKIGLGEKVRKGMLGYQTLTALGDIVGDHLPAAKEYQQFSERTRAGIEKAKNKLSLSAFERVFALPAATQEAIDQYLVKSQFFLGNAQKSWTENERLYSPEEKSAGMMAHRELQSMLSRIRQIGGITHLNDVLSTMQTVRYQELAAYAHKVGEGWFANTKEQLAGHGENPDKAFQMSPKVQDNVNLAKAYYRSELTKRFEGISARIAQVDEAVKTLKKGTPAYQKAQDSVDVLRSAARDISDGMAQADKGTYVPLGRSTGDYFVSGKIKAGADGSVAPATAAAVEKALDAAGFHVGVSHQSSSNTIMSRTESLASMRRMEEVFKTLQTQGHLDPTEMVKTGHPEDLNSYSRLSSGQVGQMIDNFKSMVRDLAGEKADASKGYSAQIVQDLVHQWLDMMPGGALQKSLQNREAIAGYSKDAIGASFVRALNSARASTAISTSGELARVMQNMRDQVSAAKEGPDSTVGHDAARELMAREALKASRITNGLAGGLQKVSSLLSVGANPAYVPLALSQVITLGHPELAKKFGYAKSAIAIGKVTTETFRIVAAVLRSEGKWDSGVRQETLEKGGVSKWAQDVAMRLENRNSLSSTYVGEQLNPEGKIDPRRLDLEKRLSVMGRTAEMIPRILTGLAAAKLHDERPLKGINRDDYVEQVVNSSQFDWSPGESSRWLGKGGLAGSYSPVMFGFKNWQNRMLLKYYTEMHAAFGGNGPEAQKEAGVFLASHLVAVVAIAGTLGLPGTNMLSGAADKTLKALTGRDDYDVQGLYRTWLAHTFGTEIGDVVAKGLPRGLGIDLSKIGTGGILPGSEIMQDKRKLEDMWEDYTREMAGAAPNQIISFVKGARAMFRGDYLLGATQMLPEGLKGLAEASYAQEHGYVDKYGSKLSAQPDGADIIMMALGLDPASLARTNEKKYIAQGLEAQKDEREQNIEQHLVRAVQQHDPDMYRHYLSAALEFQREHLGESGPINNIGPSLQEHMQQGIMARAFGMVPGVSPLSTINRSTGF